jgi:hypothetical protein
MTVRSLDLKGGTLPGIPTPDNVAHRRPATRWSVHQAMLAQDRIIGSGRRIALSLSLGPEADTFVPDTNPTTASADPDYPDSSTPYVVGRLDKFCVTPGSVFRVVLLALPSGPTQRTPGSGWLPDGGLGIVRITITLTDEDANTVTMVREISIQASQLQYGKKPDGDGDCWGVIEEEAKFCIPPGYDDDVTEAQKWQGPGNLATMEIAFIGSPRVIDLAIYEEPRQLTRDISEGVWPAHLYSQAGQPYGQYPHTYPVEASSGSDPAAGQAWLIETSRQTTRQLGPALFFGSSWDEGSATILNTFSSASHDGGNTNGTGDNEAPPINITSTSFVHLQTGASTFGAEQPGYPMGCGAYGRDHATSEQELVLPGNGVVSVVVGVYCTAGLNTGTVRFWVSAYSYVDIEIPVGGYGWHFAAGHLECGTGPEDERTCSLWGKVSLGGNLYIRYWGCWRWHA